MSKLEILILLKTLHLPVRNEVVLRATLSIFRARTLGCGWVWGLTKDLGGGSWAGMLSRMPGPATTHPPVLAGDPLQWRAWAGQCALYIVIMIFEKSVVFIVLLILQWKKVCHLSLLQKLPAKLSKQHFLLSPTHSSPVGKPSLISVLTPWIDPVFGLIGQHL